jgi:adenosylcobinamide kinase/adenosylcobinamide-phosphate guanylyltransferase
LTLWMSNLLLRHDVEAVTKKIDELIDALTLLDINVFFLTNEVGSAIVPDNALARSFRDLVGWTNQRVAQVADEVILMVAGLPVFVKKDGACS